MVGILLGIDAVDSGPSPPHKGQLLILIHFNDGVGENISRAEFIMLKLITQERSHDEAYNFGEFTEDEVNRLVDLNEGDSH